MLILEPKDPISVGQPKSIILIFGLGLIGTYIYRSLLTSGFSQAQKLPYSWTEPKAWNDEIKSFETHLTKAMKSQDLNRIDLVWAAGRGGFMSAEEDFENEFAAYSKILKFCQSLDKKHADIQLSFHLLSSLGGLFEGQTNVTSASQAAPQRPYGIAKLRQEQALQALNPSIRKYVYRPSSAYGYTGPGGRVGLIVALLKNALRNQVTTIFGLPHTLRDYVLSDDIGRFVAANVLHPDNKDKNFHLASAKPTTILEVIKDVEKIFDRKILCNFKFDTGNALNNTFAPETYGGLWDPVNLSIGITSTHRKILQDYVSG